MGEGMTSDEAERLLQALVKRALSDGVWSELRADFMIYGQMCYRVTDAGEVVRIDPATVYLDIAQES